MSRYETNVVLYRLKKDAAFRDGFRADPRRALAAADHRLAALVARP